MPSLLIPLRKILSWRPAGTDKKSNDPDATLELLERWSGWATLAIAAGIVVELGVVWYFPNDPGERIWLTLADILIFGGLIAEYIFIRRTIIASGESKMVADEKIAEANLAAAEANERAAEAE